MAIRRAVFAAEEFVRLVVAGDDAFHRIVGELAAAEAHRGHAEQATRGGDVALLDVGDGLAAFLDRGEEIEHVPTRGGGGVQLVVFFGHVLGILLALEDAVEVDRLRGLVERDEIRAHGARLERAFFPRG